MAAEAQSGGAKVQPGSVDVNIRGRKVRLAYLVAGPAGTPAGSAVGEPAAAAAGAGDPPAVLLVHGIGGSSVQWQLTLPALAGAGYFVIAPDMPWFGESGDGPQPALFADFADSLAGLLRERFPRGAHIVGQSFGGLVAQDLALRYPACALSLTLICSLGAPERRGDGTGARPRARRLPVHARRAASFLLGLRVTRALLVAVLASPLGARILGRRLVGNPGAMPRGLRWDMGRALRQTRIMRSGIDPRLPDLSSGLRGLAVPAMVVCGENDTIVPPAVGRDLAACLPTPRFEVIAGCGHLPMLEKPRALAALLLSFFAAAGRG